MLIARAYEAHRSCASTARSRASSSALVKILGMLDVGQAQLVVIGGFEDCPRGRRYYPGGG